MKRTGKWDIRCSQELIDIFQIRTGYYFKIGIEQATEICRILSLDYKINPPNIAVTCPPEGNAKYIWDTETIEMYSRNHIKSIFHEFYHHLDNKTDGKYNSDDHEGGQSSYGWQFAEKLWKLFVDKTPNYRRHVGVFRQLKLF
jgi:hypothetical protein